MPRATILAAMAAACLPLWIATARAQAAASPCGVAKTIQDAAAAPKPKDKTAAAAKSAGYDGRFLVDQAIGCVGGVDGPSVDQRLPIYVPAKKVGFVDATYGFSPGSSGASEVANEFFSLIAEIAVDKAQREGLAMVHDQLTKLICDKNLTFPIPDQSHLSFTLDQTCDLVRTTDLQTLVGQGDALRGALTGDILDAAKTAVSNSKTPDPLKNSELAAVTLIGRVASDPKGRINVNDVWLIADALLNGDWSKCTDSQCTNLKYALLAARVYVQALEWSNQTSHATIDLAYVIEKVKATNANFPTLSSDKLSTFEQRVNLAITMATAMSAGDDSSEDLQARLRAAIQLAFESVKDIDACATWPDWAEKIALAALDADAPHLISALAGTGSDLVAGSCKKGDEQTNCLRRQKMAALLTGISTYAITYEKPPDSSDSQALAAFQQQQHDARKQALESVIDAATDRRSRAGDWVWSLGVGVGFSYNSFVTSLQGQAGKEQLHLPLGLAFQRLPGSKADSGKFGFGWHLMGTALDLGNYIRSTNSTNTKIDWQSIVSPGFEGGLALGKSTTFFVVGTGVTFSPKFADVNSGTTSQSFGATKFELFAQYYFPLWDFN